MSKHAPTDAAGEVTIDADRGGFSRDPDAPGRAAPRRLGRYSGPERRRHRMFATKNTEYHLRDAICVGVRSRRTGTWVPEHRLLRARLVGGFEITENSHLIPQVRPGVGHRLVFVRRHTDVVTTEVVSMGRPPKDAVSYYAEL